ncbi:MAG: hypothetical protein CVV41_12185 [Candidatus Riflebacteria bacterium HGW-Riflebacteria-1]|nr:MAG: hypothetical protein CVV41_12185 [Candidatus Riflebacteria bacterium HGW-Riflebacteria-1]
MESDWRISMISVVIPVLNASTHYFRQTLCSLRNQSCKDFEVLVVEDPCACSVAEIVAEINDPRFIFIRNARKLGFAEQLNIGIRRAKYELIARIDADDIAREDRLTKQLEAFQNNSEFVLAGSCLTMINESGDVIGNRKYPLCSEEIRRQAPISSPVAHPAVMFRRDAILRIGGYNGEFGVTADYDLWARLLTSGHSFINLSDNLTSYRIHENASKFSSLRATLSSTVKIKKRYFVNKYYWSFSAQFRLFIEKILLRLPPSLVYKIFLMFVKMSNHESLSKT